MKIFLDALSKKPTISIGTQALILSSMQIIKRKYNDVKFIMISPNEDFEKEYLKKYEYDVTLVKRPKSQLSYITQIKKILKDVDAVVSAWGDGYITTPPHKIFLKTFFFKKQKQTFCFVYIIYWSIFRNIKTNGITLWLVKI